MLRWYDNFEIYGAGPGAALADFYSQSAGCSLVGDPDVFSGAPSVLKIISGVASTLDFTIAAAQTTIGAAARYRLSTLPGDDTMKPCIAAAADVYGNIHCYVIINRFGYLEAYRRDEAGDVLLRRSDNSLFGAGAWRHLETKFVLDDADGSVEVRYEGTTALSIAEVRTITDVEGAAATGKRVSIRNGGDGGPYLLVKDYVIWDGSGAANNSFVGRCRVLTITPGGDISLEWEPSEGETGYNLINTAPPLDDESYVAANAFASPSLFSVNKMPSSTVSVKGVMAVERSRKADDAGEEPVGEGGSTIVDGTDWVLVELPMPEMRAPRARFSAFVEAPFDALTGIGPEDWLPIQGVAWDQAIRDEYDLNPCIAFPFWGEAIVATVNEEKRIFSLLADLRGFEADDLVHIGLYGYIETYYILAGLTDGPFVGTPETYDPYGTIALDTSGVANPQTPAQWLGLQPEDTVHIPPALIGLDPFTTLVSVFPELAGKDFDFDPYDVLGVSVFFAWNHDDSVWDGGADAVPSDDPNAFMISTAGTTAFTYWGPGVLKTARTFGMTTEYIYGPGGGATDTVDTPPDPPDNGQGVTVKFHDSKTYYVPTCRFDDDRAVPVNVVGISGINLYTQQAKHDTPRPDHSLTWETDDYPDRPAMANVGTAIVRNADGPDGDVVPSNRFGHLRIGTITINKATNEVIFVPAEAVLPPPDDVGDGRVQVSIVSGANTANGADRDPTGEYTYSATIFETDPQGGGAFTPERVSSLQLKINRTE